MSNDPASLGYSEPDSNREKSATEREVCRAQSVTGDALRAEDAVLSHNSSYNLSSLSTVLVPLEL